MVDEMASILHRDRLGLIGEHRPLPLTLDPCLPNVLGIPFGHVELNGFGMLGVMSEHDQRYVAQAWKLLQL